MATGPGDSPGFDTWISPPQNGTLFLSYESVRASTPGTPKVQEELRTGLARLTMAASNHGKLDQL